MNAIGNPTRTATQSTPPPPPSLERRDRRGHHRDRTPRRGARRCPAVRSSVAAAAEVVHRRAGGDRGRTREFRRRHARDGARRGAGSAPPPSRGTVDLGGGELHARAVAQARRRPCPRRATPRPRDPDRGGRDDDHDDGSARAFELADHHRCRFARWPASARIGSDRRRVLAHAAGELGSTGCGVLELRRRVGVADDEGARGGLPAGRDLDRVGERDADPSPPARQAEWRGGHDLDADPRRARLGEWERPGSGPCAGRSMRTQSESNVEDSHLRRVGRPR